MIAHIAVALSLALLAPASPADAAGTADAAGAAELLTAQAAPSTAQADTLPLPGVSVKYQEKVGDPVRLSSYGLGTKSTYLRAKTGNTFAEQPTLSEAAVSPDAATVAGVPKSYRAGYDSLILTDRASGKGRRVRTVKKPLAASYISWSRDSKRVALTVEQKVGGKWRTVGFTVVDVVTGTARTVRPAGIDGAAAFSWNPGGNLVARYGGGLRTYRAGDGATLRTFVGVGVPTGPEDAYSPSGSRLTMWCPARFTEQLCLLNPATGVTRRLPIGQMTLFGWWDESHVIAVMTDQSTHRLSVVDLTGKVTRVLAEIPSRTWNARLWVAFTRTPR
ncbi:hypothetical protein ACQP2T_41440 [Nonomuraea sp. CA-143628]|uniref:hypothetical protein n=1 Tax=Nonomuraea sp. CA-143628 TaxID=3239997 RepID=UPI003D920B2A